MIMLGTIFVIAGIGKLSADHTAFNLYAFPSFITPTMAANIFNALPYIEIMSGVMLILGVAVKFALTLSGFLISGFIMSNIILINRGIADCGNCFGIAGSFTPTTSLILDGIMAVLVIVILYCYRGVYFNLTPWFLETLRNKDYEDVKPSYTEIY